MRGQIDPRATAICRALDDMKADRDGEPTLGDIMRMANAMSTALSSFFALMEETVQSEFRGIGSYIQNVKSDIANLQANELQQTHLPTAGRELDAVVTATEEATNTIMGCAETIMCADASDPEAYKAVVDEEVMKIFEACSFQDITGQRITKVVETLDMIERRVSRFAARFGVEDAEGHASDEEAERERRKRDLMLDGPSVPGEGIAQDEVDSLLNAAGA